MEEGREGRGRQGKAVMGLNSQHTRLLMSIRVHPNLNFCLFVCLFVCFSPVKKQNG